MIFHENRLPAEDSHEISCLKCYFWKSGKIWNGRLLQIIDCALRASFKHVIAHLSRMNFPISISRTSLFQILEVLGGILHFYSNFKRNFCKETVENLIRCWVLQGLIRFFTVRCSTKRMIGFNRLTVRVENSVYSDQMAFLKRIYPGSAGQGLSKIFCLCFFFYVPINKFSVMWWWVFLCWTSTNEKIKYLAHRQNAVPPFLCLLRSLAWVYTIHNMN